MLLTLHLQEEVSPPEMDELVGLSGHSYPAQLIRDMEICLLKKLEWVFQTTIDFFTALMRNEHG